MLLRGVEVSLRGEVGRGRTDLQRMACMVTSSRLSTAELDAGVRDGASDRV